MASTSSGSAQNTHLAAHLFKRSFIPLIPTPVMTCNSPVIVSSGCRHRNLEL